MLAGCAMPVTQVRSVDSRPSISFENPPSGADVYLDGVRVGLAEEYNGSPNQLNIEPGTHNLVVKQGDKVLLEQRFFADSEHKTFKLR